jgi:hypothetical protein
MERESQVNLSSDNNDVQVIDEEEYDLIRQIKAKKKTYTELFGARKGVADECAYLKNIVDQCQLSMAQAFLQYYQNPTPNGGSRVGADGAASNSADDQLDYGEQFERNEREKIFDSDPDSIHFYNAKKTVGRKSPRKNKEILKKYK